MSVSRIRNNLQLIDQKRCTLLDELETLDVDRLTFKPTPDSWSILQVVQHMVRVERAILQNLPEPSQLVGRKRGLRARLTYPLVVLVLKQPLRVKVPSRVMLPDGKTSFIELRRQWDESQRWLKSYVETLAPDKLNEGVFRHPVIGALTVTQAVALCLLHLERHLRQIERLQSLLNASQSH